MSLHFIGADGQPEQMRTRESAPSVGVSSFPWITAYTEMARTPGGPRQFATNRMIWLTNPWLYSAIRLHVDPIARMALQCRTLDADGNPKALVPFAAATRGRPSNAQLLAELLEMPEPRKHRVTWLRQVWLDRQVDGNGFIVFREPTQNPLDVPTRLRWVSSAMMQPIVGLGSDQPIYYREIRPHGALPAEHSPENVVHFGQGNHPWWPMGESPIQSLSSTVALFDALQRHLVHFFQNAARPSGYMQVQPGTTPANLAAIRAEVTRLWSGPENAGKPLITSAEWKTLTQDHKQSEIIELIKLSREEIAAAYRIPPPIMGILDRAIKSNVTELREFHLRDVVGMDVSEFIGDLHAQLIWQVPQWAGLQAAFNMSEPLRPDLATRATVYSNMRHVWTPNQMRKMEGDAPLTGPEGEYADTVWMPSGMVPLGLVQPQVLAAQYGPLPMGDGDSDGDVDPGLTPPGVTADPESDDEDDTETNTDEERA